MALSPKLLTLIGGIGGGCGVLPWFLKTTNNLDSPRTQVSPSLPDSSLIESQLPSKDTISTLPKQTPSSPAEIIPQQQPPSLPPEEKTEDTNCKVIEALGDVFYTLGGDVDAYFTISCNNASKDSEDVRMEGKWTILIPDTLLVDRNTLRTNPNFEIKTTTTLKGVKRKTIFEGSRFPNSSITGEWEEPAIPTEDGM